VVSLTTEGDNTMETYYYVKNGLVAGLAALLWGLAGASPGMPAASVKPQLLADVATIAPGEPFHAGVLFKMAEGWHIYWKNPGDAGLATAVEWQLPEGFSAGPLRWPQPKTFVQPGDIVGYGYEKEVLLEATITPPKDLSPGAAVAISAKATWLGCGKLCVPGKEDLTLDLTVKAAADTASTPANRDLFATWEAQMPPPAPDFALPDQAGARASLSDYKGRVVVLEWFNPDCPFVQRHHAQRTTMIDLAGKYAPKGVVWLAVNTTYYMTPETTAEARTKWKMDYPVLIDRQGKVGRAYGAKATPDMFVIDRDGEIVYQGAIDNDPPGEMKSPVNYVDKALTELLAGKPVSEPKTTPYGCSVKYAPPSVYDFSMDSIEGRPVDLRQHAG